ncbi:MAG TPA: hypothetical protein VK644_03960 [Chitinophagaceae bacterium]|nr:hypothetical protein [Chitinophagaceae bacterium]
MATAKTNKTKPVSQKKQNLLKVIGQLKENFSQLEELVGKKDFESRTKKAAKILMQGIKIKEPKLKKQRAQKSEIPVA